jgi:hypothetical protein
MLLSCIGTTAEFGAGIEFGNIDDKHDGVPGQLEGLVWERDKKHRYGQWQCRNEK